MTDQTGDRSDPRVIATIENQQNPGQVISIVYVPEENGFATSGIRTHFELPEILIPAHLVAQDLELMGSIVSAILEKISKAWESESTFTYSSSFEVMGRSFTMAPHGRYVKLDSGEGPPEWAKEGEEP
ncbi:MAG: hypothetical protein ACLFUE_00635 [Desulfobacteraceae bacterium]